MGQPMENTEQVAASPDIQPNVEAFVGAAIDAYKAYEAYVSPPNTEATGGVSASAHIPNLSLIGSGTELAKDNPKLNEKLPPKELPNNVEGPNALPAGLEKVGVGTALGRAQGAKERPDLNAGEMNIIRDAVGLGDGQFDRSAPGQHLADGLRRLEAKGGADALKARLHDLNEVLEATGSRYELQVRTSPSKGGPPTRNLSIIDATTGDVSASMPFPMMQNMVKPEQPRVFRKE